MNSDRFAVMIGLALIALTLLASILCAQIVADGVRDCGRYISQTAANGQVQAYEIIQQERANQEAILKRFHERNVPAPKG